MSASGGYVTSTNPSWTARDERQHSLDLKGRLRTTDEASGDFVAISVGGGDQTLATAGRGVYVGGAGNLVCRLVDASSDATFTGLLAGTVYPFRISIIRQTGTTITNSNILL